MSKLSLFQAYVVAYGEKRYNQILKLRQEAGSSSVYYRDDIAWPLLTLLDNGTITSLEQFESAEFIQSLPDLIQACHDAPDEDGEFTYVQDPKFKEPLRQAVIETFDSPDIVELFELILNGEPSTCTFVFVDQNDRICGGRSIGDKCQYHRW